MDELLKEKKPRVGVTPMQLLSDWLSKQPPLVLRSDVQLRIQNYLVSVEKKHFIRAYSEGYDAYSHPKKYKTTAADWYRQKYNRIEVLGYRKPTNVIKIYENGTNKPRKSLRKRDVR